MKKSSKKSLRFEKFNTKEENTEKCNKPVSMFDLSEMGDEALGLKLMIDCYHGSFVGVLHQILIYSNRVDLWLEQVSLLTSGQRLIGLVKFFYVDVINMEIIGVDMEAKKRLLLELRGPSHAQNLLMKQIIPTELTEEDYCESAFVSFEDFLNSLNSNLPSKEKLTLDHCIIDHFDEEFDKAMLNVEKEKIICLSYEGMEVGRFGKLSWLCACTTNTIYLFDLGKLDMKTFLSKGFEKIFTNSDQMKIFNDSRYIQDLLFHLFECSMVNVFDLQASVVFLNMLFKNRQVPNFISSLSSLVHKYLKLPYDVANKYLVSMKDESEWFERPLLNKLTNHLFFSVIFLRRLQELMTSDILTDLKNITAIFHMSEANKSLTLVNQYDRTIIPYALQNIDKIQDGLPNIQYIRHKRSHRRRKVRSTSK